MDEEMPTDEQLQDDEAQVTHQLIIASDDSAVEEVDLGEAPAKPINELTGAEQKALADKIVAEIDDHDDGIPFLPLNLAKFNVWSFENCMLPPDVVGEDPQPGVIITFASADDPRGTPYILTRDRALKFASQLKKRANTGPSLQQRAAEAGIAVPGGAGGLVGPDGTPLASVVPVEDDE